MLIRGADVLMKVGYEPLQRLYYVSAGKHLKCKWGARESKVTGSK